jgi:hypothetical protein
MTREKAGTYTACSNDACAPSRHRCTAPEELAATFLYRGINLCFDRLDCFHHAVGKLDRPAVRYFDATQARQLERARHAQHEQPHRSRQHRRRCETAQPIRGPGDGAPSHDASALRGRRSRQGLSGSGWRDANDRRASDVCPALRPWGPRSRQRTTCKRPPCFDLPAWRGTWPGRPAAASRQRSPEGLERLRQRPD